VLADHFKNAEDRPKALVYMMGAAEAAINAYAFNNAITHLNDAIALLPDSPDGTVSHRVWRMLGDACGASGRLDAAIGAYRRALEHAPDRIARATVQHGIGENYHRKGLFDDAFRHFYIALDEVGYARPRSLPGRLFDMWRTSVFFHMLPSWLRVPGGGADRDRRSEIAFASYYRVCLINATTNLLDYAHCSYKIAAFAKASRKPEHIAVAYSKLGLNCSVFSLHWLGMVYVRHALRAAEACPRHEVRAMARAHVGTA
jgi:tetratricopeptide (TPR) repeat protein